MPLWFDESGEQVDAHPETQEVVDYCAQNNILPQIEMIKASEINTAWDKVVNKEARYRYVLTRELFKI